LSIGCGGLVIAALLCASGLYAIYSLFGEGGRGNDSAVATSVASAAADEPGTAQAEPHPLNEADTTRAVASLPGRIAFINGAGAIGTVGPGGEELRLLTEGSERVYLFPAWSPDRQEVAAIGIDNAGAGVFTVTDEEDEELRELYYDRSDAPVYLYWDPSGERVSFIARFEDELGLYLADNSGAGESRLVATGQPIYWDWLQGSGRIIIHTGSPGADARLSLIDANSDAPESLPNPGYFQAPGVSWQSDYLAFAELDAAEARWLVVRDARTGDEERTPHLGLVAMGWSPSANQLAFISPNGLDGGSVTDFFGPLRLFDAATNEARTLAEETVLAFFWAPDGSKIAYLAPTGTGGNQVAQAVRRARFRPFAFPPAQHERLQLSLHIVDVATGENRRLLSFRPSELFVRQFIPFFDQYGLSHSVWSPDSQAIVLPILDDETERIFVVDTESGGARPVAEGSIAFWSRH
jgi:TolB protein